MNAAAQDVGLVAGLAGEGNDAPFRNRAVRRPQLLDEADLFVGNAPNRQPGKEREQDEKHRRCRRDRGDKG